MRRSERKVGDVIGGWRLVHWLGKGGNAEVWRACRGEHELALKILRQFDVRTEPYKRFMAEVKVLDMLGSRAGILPLVQYSLPERPSRQNPSWLAMPEATSVELALGERPDLRSVVEAVAAFASTLAELSTQGIFHRDIK